MTILTLRAPVHRMPSAGLFEASLVREAANSRWPVIFAALGIEVGNGRHQSCPVCGGKDRFRFDDHEDRGTWFCNQCDPQAGDGFALVQKVRGCSFPETLRLVASILGITAQTAIDRTNLDRARRQRERDKQEHERQRRLSGLKTDAQREADALIVSARNIDISGWSNARLDRELDRLADAYGLVEREMIHGD